MPVATTKSDKLPQIRVTESEKLRIQRAAEYRGMTLSEYVLSALRPTAEADVRERDMALFNAEDASHLVETVLSDAPATEALVAAARDYKAWKATWK